MISSWNESGWYVVKNWFHMYHTVFIVGFCSDGEFNSLRNHGYTRPLSVRSDVRSKYSRMSMFTMKAMLTPKAMLYTIHRLERWCLFSKAGEALCIHTSPRGTLLCPSLFCSLCRWTNWSSAVKSCSFCHSTWWNLSAAQPRASMEWHHK